MTPPMPLPGQPPVLPDPNAQQPPSAAPPVDPNAPQVTSDETKTEASSINSAQGNAFTMVVDPMDIQDEFDIMPEEGSTLAADDVFKTQSIQNALQLAMQIPTILNVRSIASKLLATMPGLNPEQDMMPPPTPPPPKPPDIKVSVNISTKLEDQEPDVQAALLKRMDLPTQDTEGEGTLDKVHKVLDTVGKVRDAANAASELEQPAPDGTEPKTPTPPNTKLL